jgi:RND family efflux transporter MFP subunit
MEAQSPSDPPDREQHEDLSNLPTVGTRSVAIAVAIAVCAFAGLFLLGWIPHRDRTDALNAAAADQDDRPPVDTVRPKPASEAVDLRLPADVRSMQQTSIIPRANGYLKRILVDIGDHVEAGALLAEIDTPDVDADLARATANVELSNANLLKAQEDFALADTTLKRYANSVEGGGVTRQQLDERRSALSESQASLAAARAGVAVAEADVRRLTVLQGFERVTAPFSGTITARNNDVGALLTPSNTTEGRELYRIDRTDSLRVFVNVPQTYATAVKVGDDAFLSVRNHVGREFAGKIARTAGAIDPATRTLRTQIDVPNADGVLYSGMYGEVRLPLRSGHPSLVVPTSALVFVADGTWVWTVESDRARRRKVAVGRDFGTEIEVLTGLTEQDTVVKNPGERLVDGVEVRASSEPEARKAEGATRAAPTPAATRTSPGDR